MFLDWDPRYLYRKLFGDDGREWRTSSPISARLFGTPNRTAARASPRPARSGGPSSPGHAELIDAWGERAEEMIRGVHPGQRGPVLPS